MIKAIFFDIDGTLLSAGGHVLPSTKKALRKAQEKGILVGVATGRDPAKVARLLKSLPLDMYVTYNGQLVYTDNELIYARTFEKAALEQIVNYADQKSRSVNFGLADHVIGSRLMKLGQSVAGQRLVRFLPQHLPVGFMKRVLQRVHFLRSNQHYRHMGIVNQAVYQCMMFSPVAGDQQLAKALPACDLLRSNSFSVDIVPKGVSKLAGIQHFLAEKKIAPSEAMAFGDHLNDIDMLMGVGIGVAMGNGQRQAKDAADYVTGSNNSDGIAKALKHFGII